MMHNFNGCTNVQGVNVIFTETLHTVTSRPFLPISISSLTRYDVNRELFERFFLLQEFSAGNLSTGGCAFEYMPYLVGSNRSYKITPFFHIFSLTCL